MSKKTNKSFLDQLFYYIGKMLRPFILSTMAKKDSRVAKNLENLEKARKDFDDSLEEMERKYDK